MEIDRINSVVDAYKKIYNNFENILVDYRQQIVMEQLKKYKPTSILEIGVGLNNILYNKILKNIDIYNNIQKWTCIEPCKEFIDNIKINDKKFNIIEGFFENINFNHKYDFIIISGLLHEVENPNLILQKSKNFLSENGMIHINVPNSNSFHRELGTILNIIKNKDSFSELDKKLQHYCIFNNNSLESLIKKNKLKIVDNGGYFFKLHSNNQLFNLYNEYGSELMNGLFELGKRYPDKAAEIFINCSS
tara:strand:+ start:15443 stop:16186 length:744 start_codon:yes stop_codon:yes gene_type:complete